MSRLTTDLTVLGHLSATTMDVPTNSIDQNAFKATTAIPRTLLAQRVLASLVIPHTAWHVWDALHTNLPGTPADDDLGLDGGTFATSTPMITTGDLKAAGSTTRKARALVQLPHDYEDGETVYLRLHAGMVTNAADVAATLDVQAFASDREGGLGSELYTGAALDVNYTALADFNYLLTPTGLEAGDWLDIVLSFLVNDAATGTAVIGVIGDSRLLYDAR